MTPPRAQWGPVGSVPIHTIQLSTAQLHHVCRRDLLIEFSAFTSPFAVSSSCTDTLCPFVTAECREVSFYCTNSHQFHHISRALTSFSAFGLPFAVSSNCTDSLCPFQAAQCSGVHFFLHQSNHTAQHRTAQNLSTVLCRFHSSLRHSQHHARTLGKSSAESTYVTRTGFVHAVWRKACHCVRLPCFACPNEGQS